MRLAHKSNIVAAVTGAALVTVIGMLIWAGWVQGVANRAFDEATDVKSNVSAFSSLAMEALQRPSKRVHQQWSAESQSVRDRLVGMMAEGRPDAIELDRITSELSHAFDEVVFKSTDANPRLRRMQIGRLIAKLQQMSELADRLVTQARIARDQSKSVLQVSIWTTIGLLLLGIPLLLLGFRTAALQPLHRLTQDVAFATLKNPLDADRWQRKDEFGQLGREFAKLQNRVQAAFKEVADQNALLEQSARNAEEAARLARDAESRARMAAEAKSRFLATISHEIRTPMNGIMGMAELLNASKLTEDQRQCADTIRNSATALLSLINDILDISKIEAQKVVIDQEPVFLSQLLDDVALLLSPNAADRGLEILVDDHLMANGGTGWYQGDATRLRQILVNIVGNAVKFTLEGRVVLSARIAKKGSFSDEVEISVSDTGIGVPPDKLASIFDPFEQADDTISRRFEGSGLGLAISKSLVSAMGGDIHVTSKVGEGTTFTLRLDLRVLGPPPPVGKSAVSAQIAGTALLIHGDATSGQIAASMLRKAGLAVRSRGQEALKNPGDLSGQADVLVFDLDSSGTLSPDTVEAFIKEMPPDLSCLVLATRKAGLDLPGRSVAIQRKPLRQTALNEVLLRLQEKPPCRSDQNGTGDSVETPDLKGRKLLIADDNKTNRLVLKMMFDPTGAELTFAENGAEAIREFSDGCFDAILMDASMPVMDGHQATRRIRLIEARRRGSVRCPVIAVTAHAMREDHDACLAAGMDYVLTKPVRRIELFEKLSGALGSSGAVGPDKEGGDGALTGG